MHACTACIAPLHHRPMHAVTAWALLFWFCLRYTFTSSYFGLSDLTISLTSSNFKIWSFYSSILFWFTKTSHYIVFLWGFKLARLQVYQVEVCMTNFYFQIWWFFSSKYFCNTKTLFLNSIFFSLLRFSVQFGLFFLFQMEAFDPPLM